MKLLLDTHVAIWAVSDTIKLPGAIRAMLSETRNDIYVSVVSVLEIAIKNAAGRRNAPPFSSAVAMGYFRGSGYRMLDVTVDHALAVEDLAPIHHDPFDRLLVAQALSEPMRLITRDAQVAAYSDSIIRF